MQIKFQKPNDEQTLKTQKDVDAKVFGKGRRKKRQLFSLQTKTKIENVDQKWRKKLLLFKHSFSLA